MASDWKTISFPGLDLTAGAGDTKAGYMPIPTVIENTSRGIQGFDLWSRLLQDRILFLGTDIDDHVANVIIAQLLWLESQDPEKDIHLYINSPGGSVTAGLGIYDIMQYISCPVNTYCTGMAASMASVLLCAGTKGKRYALPNSRVMIHQPLGGVRGQAADIERHAREIMRLRDLLNGIYNTHTGKPIVDLLKDMDRDNFMSPQEAKEYGLIDEIVSRRKDIK